MTNRSALVASSAILFFSMTACVGGDSAGLSSLDETDPALWARTAFGDDEWQGPGTTVSAGGLAPGSDAGLSFTPENPGWYRVAMSCKGPSSMSVKVSGSGNELGTGFTPCGTTVTTTMKLPAGMIDIRVDGANARGMWAVALAPTDAP
ncbi:hypothetical protein [Arthrobacter sp. VKM Ac-2550]|uniref:hypothetical protein n=1 Tax=Crystallibacter permensis TaxID=1938888 RepID=UPI002227D09B|nr:hypothetical protein [Arthrobacter sp. VKM Ac-2550]MCW2134994.1 hypothetical protein [Arthrobacter sp. VKM Ac-2550]